MGGLRRLIVVLSCLLVGVALNFGNLRQADTADVWISTLTSLTAYSPYEWGSNRFGTLAPLLAAGFHDPLVNHFVQNGLTVSAVIASAFLLGGLPVRVCRTQLACTTLMGLFVLSGPAQLHVLSSYSHPYALSFCLGMLGWQVGTRMLRAYLGLAAASLCFLLSLWVNISFGPWLAVAIAACRPRCKRAWALSVLVFLAFCLNLMLASLHPFRVAFQFGVSQHPLETAWSLFSNFLQALQAGPALVWMLASCWVGWNQTGLRSEWRQLALALGLANLCHWLFLSSSYWIEVNEASPRYMTPVLWSLALISGLPLTRLLRYPLLAWTGLGLLSLLRLGARSPESWLTFWSQSETGVLTTLKENQVRVLIGEYWTTWTWTYLAYVQAYREGREPLWACTQRSENTREFWQPELLAGECAAIDLKNEDKAFRWLAVAHVPLAGRTFVPQFVDSQLLVGRWLEEAPVRDYHRFEHLPEKTLLNFADQNIWRFLGQGWGGPDLQEKGRFLTCHQADFLFAERARTPTQFRWVLRSAGSAQEFSAFLNGKPVGQGKLPAGAATEWQIDLPPALVADHNVFSFSCEGAYPTPEGQQLRSMEVLSLRVAGP